ncbi:3-keto-disaccharide hydrolase [Bryobacter aggregatus]|uniref:3-keto-disaccharide hydrolase n=1 Tax=Bryobacter aggregatus TaxID=360054 RepID=UPI001EE367AA|nr:DUF1080 domain-containing protein [Bryobacter aggregatus]
MTRRQLIVLGGALAAPVYGQETGLFDGKSLKGWKIENGPETAFYAQDGEIVVHPGSNYPSWLRSDAEYENFDWSGEVFIQNWANGGLYFAAPKHGPPTYCGFKLNIFQKEDNPPLRESVGSIFPVVAPSKVTVRNKGEWNQFRIRMDWPSLKVWWNGVLVQDIDVEKNDELKFRLRRGHLGIESLSYPLRYRNFKITRLPGKEKWEVLYNKPEDLSKWNATEKASWEAIGNVLRADGLGYLVSKERYQDFRFECYIRASKNSNGGVLFRGGEDGKADRYEIQVHDVEGAVYPTGSLYHYERASRYPRIQPEEWYLFQLVAKGKRCVVRIQGETLVDCEKLERTVPGTILIQAHQKGSWIEYKDLRIQRI